MSKGFIKNSFYKLVLLLVIISQMLLTSSCVEDPAGIITPTSVGGIVKGEDDKPIEGAKVSANGKTSLTNAKGYYVLSGLTTSSITLTVSKEG